MEHVRMRPPYIYKKCRKMLILKSQTFEILNSSLKKIIFNFSILKSYSQMSFSRVRGCGPIHGTEMMMTHFLIDESFFIRTRRIRIKHYLVSNLKIIRPGLLIL